MKQVLIAAIALFVGFFFYAAPGIVYRYMNFTNPDPNEPIITDAAYALHSNLEVADFHADTLLWYKDALQESDEGHVDVPRLVKGNVALQGFGIVTRSPIGLNFNSNSNATHDSITLLLAAQRWGVKPLLSLKERALYQSRRLHNMARDSNGVLKVIKYKEDLEEYLKIRQEMQKQTKGNVNLTAGFLGIEGAHAIEDKLDNVNELFEAGVRVMSPAHFFDNLVGGSAHGEGKYGLTEFGREVVQRMEELGMLVDIAHCSTAVIEDVLSIAKRPVVATHTGVNGVCESPRNLPDETLRRIAKTGGVIGIGYFEPAVCKATVKEIVKSIRHAVNIMGIQHVCLGSDYDGSVGVPFATDRLVILTQALLEGFTNQEVALIMGRNLINLLLRTLPAQS